MVTGFVKAAGQDVVQSIYSPTKRKGGIPAQIVCDKGQALMVFTVVISLMKLSDVERWHFSLNLFWGRNVRSGSKGIDSTSQLNALNNSHFYCCIGQWKQLEDISC